MWFWWFILICDLFVPILMIVGGLTMVRHYPKTINGWLGYRTTRSMKNTDTWKFAHQYCGRLWWKIGITSLVVTVLAHLPFYSGDENTLSILSLWVMFFQVIVLIAPIYPTEKALNRTFDEHGNRR